MDRTDFQLIAALHADALQGLRGLGRSAGITGPAAAARLRRLQEQGVLNGFTAHLDPGLFGLRERILVYPPPRTRDEALRALQVPDVALVALKVEGALTVAAWSDGSDAVSRGLEAALDGPPGFTTLGPAHTFPELSPLDWRVLRALVDEPRHTNQQLAEHTGLTAATASKRRDALVAMGAVQLMPNLGALTGGGDVVFTVAVYGDPTLAALSKVLGDVVVVNELADPPARFLLCRADDLADATARTAAAAKLPGSSAARMTLNREVWIGRDMMRRRIDAKIAAWEKAKPAVRGRVSARPA